MTEQAPLIAPPESEVTEIAVHGIVGADDVTAPTGLIESMRKNGLLQPIIVERGAEDRVVAGRRRVAAARALGWEWIDAVVFGRGDINPATIGLIENSVRSSNPLSEYHMIAEKIGEGKTESEIAAEVGMPVATIRKRRKLSNLILEAHTAVLDGNMAIGVAEEMASLPHEAQRRVFENVEGTDAKRITAAMVREAKSVAQQSAWGNLGLPSNELFVGSVTWKDQALNHLEAALSVMPQGEGTFAEVIQSVIRELEGSDAARSGA